MLPACLLYIQNFRFLRSESYQFHQSTTVIWLPVWTAPGYLLLKQLSRSSSKLLKSIRFSVRSNQTAEYYRVSDIPVYTA